MKKNVLLGISGGIAAYKIVDLINVLKKEDVNVDVILTYAALQIISAEEIKSKTEVQVYSNLFAKEVDRERILKERKVEHIELAKKADLIVVAPATANVLAKLALGIADDFLTTTVLAATCPVIVCPSMNVHMWENPATQNNINTLYSRGFQIINPDSGMLACGYEGQGRLADINFIAKEILTSLDKTNALQGKKVIVTSGGTIEPIDDVRFIANKSSGKMGAAIAESAFLASAQVTIIRSKLSVKPRFNINEKIFETAKELEELLKKEVKDYDIVIHVAAVSDFKVEKPFKGKIKSDKELSLNLIPQEKILEKIKSFNPKIILVGFKALFDVSKEKLISESLLTLKKSNADYIVANDVSKKDRGFESETNEVWIVNKKGSALYLPLASKSVIGQRIIEVISKDK